MTAKYKINPHTGQLDRVDDPSIDGLVNDSDADGIIDKAESLDDGAGNTATASDVKDAVTKKHTQNTDQKLDEGGANEVGVADVKDSVTKKHTQNSDTKLDEGGSNEITAELLKLANGRSHSTNRDRQVLNRLYPYIKRQPNSKHVRCVILYNGIYYFGCNNGFVMEFDGTSWTSTVRIGQNINAVVEYNGVLYFACNSGYVLEFDGVNWSYAQRETWKQCDLKCAVVYNGVLYLAGKKGAVVEFDGANWSSEGKPANDINCCIEYNGTLYFGCNNGEIAEFDGVNWTPGYQAISGSWKNVLCVVEYNNKLYWGRYGNQIYEFDGTIWKEYNGLAYGKDLNTIIVFNNLMLIGCNDGNIQEFDGINFYLKNISALDDIMCSIEINGEVYFGVKNGYIIEYSESGIKSEDIQESIDLGHEQNSDTHLLIKDWTAQTTALPLGITSFNPLILSDVIEYNGKLYGQYLAERGTVWPDWHYDIYIVEFDGTNWSIVYTVLDSGQYLGDSIIYNNKLYFVEQYGLVVEFDGATWSHASRFSGRFTGNLIEYNSKLYFGTSAGYVVEYDGISWSEAIRETNGNNWINDGVIYNNKLYFGTDNGYVVEYDGISWSSTLREPSGYHLMTGIIVYNNKLYIGSRGDGSTIVEFDGATWTSTKRADIEYFGVQLYNNTLYWGGWEGKYLTFDGTSWSTFEVTLPAGEYGGGFFFEYNGLTYALLSDGYLIELDNDWRVTQKISGYDSEWELASYPIIYNGELKMIGADEFVFENQSIDNIQTAVNKAHTQNTDQKLDEGGVNEVAVADVKDAVTKKHSHLNQNLDLGTGELKIKVFIQDTEPTLNDSSYLAMWHDTGVSGGPAIYLIYRIGSGDQVKVQLT